MIKQGLAAGIYYSGLLRLIVNSRRVRVGSRTVVLMYHRVLDSDDPESATTEPGIVVTPATFRRQMDFIRSHFQPIADPGRVESDVATSSPHAHQVAITFDDGWEDNYRNAYPILREYHLPAMIFLCVELVGTDDAPWFAKVGYLTQAWAPGARFGGVIADMKDMDPDDIEFWLTARLKDDIKTTFHQTRRMLNWTEVEEMSHGGISFGSHGLRHTILTRLSSQQMSDELTVSRETMRRYLGEDTEWIAYPNGDFNAEVIAQAKAAGYKGAFATDYPGCHETDMDVYAIPRVNIHEGTSRGAFGGFSKALFACAIHRVFPFG